MCEYCDSGEPLACAWCDRLLCADLSEDAGGYGVAYVYRDALLCASCALTVEALDKHGRAVAELDAELERQNFRAV